MTFGGVLNADWLRNFSSFKTQLHGREDLLPFPVREEFGEGGRAKQSFPLNCEG